MGVVPFSMKPVIKRPIICFCSGSNIHKTDHIECRCDGQQRHNDASSEHARQFRSKPNVTPDVLWPKQIISCAENQDVDGYPLCPWCGLIRFKEWLVQCPYCDKYFKGPTFWFDKKFHYECEECG